MYRYKTLRVLASAILSVGLMSASLRAQAVSAPPKAGPAVPPRIEVCFVLDTTGSMGGLIEGAKAKIWSIANQMIAAKPTPQLKLALVAYRDRGDEYITRLFDLTEDIDTVYANLQKFEARAGGDTPESVNQALHEAVEKIAWSPDHDVLKIVFLVGDSPPHMDYNDDVKYPDVCQRAMQKDLIINAVQCGNNGETTAIWQEIAKRAEGSFVAISQTGDMQVVSTPVDKDLAELNVTLGTTLVPYGQAERQRAVAAKQAASETAPAAAAAERLGYGAARGGRIAAGGGDLVDDLREGRVKLAELKKEDLPPAMQKLTLAEQETYLKQKAEKRGEVQLKVNALLKQRQALVEAEVQKQRESGKGNAFDLQVGQVIREQAQRKGIRYDEPTTQPAAASSQPAR